MNYQDLKRYNSDFQLSEKLKDFVINPQWQSNEDLWNFIAGANDAIWSKIHSNNVDFVKNIADVDFCGLRELHSIATSIGFNAGLTFINNLPAEIYDLLNILSVKKSLVISNLNFLTDDSLTTLLEDYSTPYYQLSGTYYPVVSGIPEDTVSEFLTDSVLTDRFADSTFDEQVLKSFLSNSDFKESVIKPAIRSFLVSKLDITMNAGNRDIDDYRDLFLQFVTKTDYLTLYADKNVNLNYYNYMIYGDFCDSVTSIAGTTYDWYQTSQQEAVLSDVVDILSDVALKVRNQREVIKKVVKDYAVIGTVNAVERAVTKQILKNYTKNSNTFDTSGIISNDEYLPALSAIVENFSVDVVEYYDNTDYFNISAETPYVQELSGYAIETSTSAVIDASGNLELTSGSVSTPVYQDSNTLEITGGNSRFWEDSAYLETVTNNIDDLNEFYSNISEYQDFTDYTEVSGMIYDLWDMAAVSAYSDEDIQKKYTGIASGYFPAGNYKNQLYPTVATTVNLLGLIETDDVHIEVGGVYVPGTVPETVPSVSGSTVFNDVGDLIDSWRYDNMELRGYNSTVEKSTNLDSNLYVNHYIDNDGPFMGDALSGLIYESMDASGTVTALDSDEVSGFILEHTDDDDFVLSDYISIPDYDVAEQLEHYQTDIYNLKDKAIAKYETDIYGNCFTLYKDGNKFDDIYASVYVGDIYEQENRSGTFLPLGQTSRYWQGLASNDNDIYACVLGGDIYKQTDGAGDFVGLSQTSREWLSIATFGDDVYASVYMGDIYKQTNGAGDFVGLSQTSRYWQALTSNDTDVYACVLGGDIYKQTGGTGNFIALGQTNREWLSMTTFGDDVYASVYMGDIYKQTGGAGDFIALGQASRFWQGLSSNGTDVYACVLGGDIYKQTGGTDDFSALGQSSREWLSITAFGDSFIALGGSVNTYSGIGDLWMRFNNHPFSYPCVNSDSENYSVDQLNVGITNPSLRAMFNNCVDFGIMGDVMYIAGYDELSSFNVAIIEIGFYNGTDNFGITDYSNVHFLNNAVDGDRIANYTDFIGVSLSENTMSFMKYENFGITHYIYDRDNEKILSGSIYTTQYSTELSGLGLIPTTVGTNNPFRVCSDSDYTYIGFRSGTSIVTYSFSKYTLTFKNYLTWTAPDGVELDAIVIGDTSVKFSFSDGRVYYGELIKSQLLEGNTTLKSTSGISYTDELLNVDNLLYPNIDISSMAQWGRWCYSVSERSLFTPAHDPVVRTGWSSWLNGFMMPQVINDYVVGSGGESGYIIDTEYNQMTSGLQIELPVYAPDYVATGLVSGFPSTGEAYASIDDQSTLSSYYGLPFNDLYVENMNLHNGISDRTSDKVACRFQPLKNFYDWNYQLSYDKTYDLVNGWRSYTKCGIAQYSGIVWMVYNYIKDSSLTDTSAKTVAIDQYMSQMDMVEVISSMINLGEGQQKSNIYSVRISNSGLSDISDTTVRDNLMNQIKVGVRKAVKKLMPAHTQLWKIQFVD